MKRLLSILTYCFLISSLLHGQSQYESGMQKAFELWGQGKNKEAVALFERISQAEKDNWLPPYYAANVLIVQSFAEGENKDKMLNLEKAKTHIQEAHNRSENNSEITTMEGLLYTAYVAMDPGVYAMQYSQKINDLHDRAIKLDPENPRAQSNKIEYEMGAARFFGQDLQPYCDRLSETIPLYEKQKSDIPFYPSYGKERIQETIDNCGK